MENNIIKIKREYKNGMYRDKYTVFYKDGSRREYKIKGAMIKKHFMFCMNAKCETKHLVGFGNVVRKVDTFTI